MSMRTSIGLLCVFSLSLVAAPSQAEASDPKRGTISKRHASSKRISTTKHYPSSGSCNQGFVQSCLLHDHDHALTGGIRYFQRRGVCMRRLANGTLQRWQPATSRVVCRKVPGIPTFRTVTRFRLIWQCGVRIRVPYCDTIEIPGKDRMIKERVHVPGRWIPYKRNSNQRYGTQLSFQRY